MEPHSWSALAPEWVPPARHHGLDFLRATMMLLGVVLHIAASYVAAPADGGWPLRDPNGTALAGPIALGIHVFRMPAFFFLSGFFGALVVARRGLRAWLADRLLRIAFPMVMAWIVLFPITKLAFTYAIGRALEATGNARASTELIGTALTQPWANPSPMHLWFLLYLLALCLLAGVLSKASRIAPLGLRAFIVRAPATCLGGWREPFLLAALALAALLPMLAMPGPGIATPSSFAIQPSVLLCYGVYFFGGWILALNPHPTAALLRGARRRLALGSALLLVSIALAIAWFVLAASPDSASRPAIRLVFVLGQASQALSAWLLILGASGLAERAIRTPNRLIRTMVDSSYWVYLVHLPICVFVIGQLIPWSAPGALKLLVAIAISLVLLALGFGATTLVLPRRANPPMPG
jgi:peptidoglycan/LPS O-acetylase OafA/YrhL